MLTRTTCLSINISHSTYNALFGKGGKMDSWTKRSDSSTIWSDRQGNVSAPLTWTTLLRPASPFDGQTGLNSDLHGLEMYNATTGKWKVLSGNWATSTRPTGVDVGSQGFNTDTGMGLEVFYGPAETDWQLL